MLTLQTSPELEARLQSEAARRGQSAEEYALRLLEANVAPQSPSNGKSAPRLSPFDVMGEYAHLDISSEHIIEDRRAEVERDEARYQERHAKSPATVSNS